MGHRVEIEKCGYEKKGVPCILEESRADGTVEWDMIQVDHPTTINLIDDAPDVFSFEARSRIIDDENGDPKRMERALIDLLTRGDAKCKHCGACVRLEIDNLEGGEVSLIDEGDEWDEIIEEGDWDDDDWDDIIA